MDTLNVGKGSFTLSRVPRAGKRPLRAWDAADEYVLDDLADLATIEADIEGANTIIIGDSFGALACGLASFGPIVINESAAGRQAISENLEASNLTPEVVAGVRVQSILDLDETMSDQPFDLVIIKIPKATPQLVEILHILRPHLTASTRIIGAGMAKHIHTSTIDAFEKVIGPTTTSLAKKKARLIQVVLAADRTPRPNPWPKTWKAHGHTLINHGGGFSPNKLDPGTSLLLDSLRSIDELIPEDAAIDGAPFRVVDLGCGNGIVGLYLAAIADQAAVEHHVHAVDDSALAIKAATASWMASRPAGAGGVDFHHAHRLVNVLEPASVDLVVVNPPFHEDRVLGDEVAWSMFVDAHKVLRPGGKLVVVGNRHLAYHAKLKKIFGSANNVGSNAKFVVLEAQR